MATINEQPASGTPIPTPSDFPVTWEKPADERMFWTLDLLHYPEPITPMDGVFAQYTYQDGFNAAAEVYEMPVRMGVCHVNTYFYMTIIPIGAPPEPVIKLMNRIGRVAPGLIASIQDKAVGAQTKKYLEKMEPVMARLGDHWNTELLPEVKEHLAYWENFDLRGASRGELLVHLEETVERIKRLWEIHFQVVFPYLISMNMFDEMYSDLFGGEGALEAYGLLRGFDNKVLETDRELWRLSRKALLSPKVLRVLEEHAAADVVGALEESAEGRAFLARFRDYLDHYGQRSNKFCELSDPSWIEDPSPVIKNLKDYVTQPDRDHEAELAALAAERERLVAQARERITGHPQPAIERFEFLLKAAQDAAIVGEDHNFWIDQRGTHQVRQVLREFGRRFAEAGVLDKPDDVFYLVPDELRETATKLPRIDRRRLAAARQAKMEYFRDIQPPPAIGRTPLIAPPDDPLGRAIGGLFGAPPKPQSDPNLLHGNAGSPGKVRGRAKVVRSLSEAGELQEGDILVAETTAPSWTPLFATAAAVVTDTGGVLSHCAVIAREYRIPAVVGTGTATATIRDGQLLEVDGDAGVIRVVPSA